VHSETYVTKPPPEGRKEGRKEGRGAPLRT
jgi:hypothetical protein